MSPTVVLPPAIPSTVHAAAPPPATVAVNCCDRVSVMAAKFGDRLIEMLDIPTAAMAALLVPPAPLQVSE